MLQKVKRVRKIHHGIEIGRQNRLHPYCPVYIADDGRVVADHSKAKHLLDFIRAA